MSNFKLGKREGDVYCLLDGTQMTKQEWIKAVRQKVEKSGDQAKLEALKKVAYRTHSKAEAEEIALLFYENNMHKNEAWKQLVGYTEETFKGLKEVVGELGEKQIAFF